MIAAIVERLGESIIPWLTYSLGFYSYNQYFTWFFLPLGSSPLHDLEGYAIAATKNQVFEAILIMMLRSLQAISRAFFMINLPSRVKS
jgi:hypothetical protein